ncbi:hypothetical protein H6B11_10885 [Mediterraneibacter glycyrrhizinilyticus]|nr:hypothetical protein [Mediterraneibacter glycyrrhizinilyticus]MBM6854656.1 hypothetical protein [Mediterraneibacter glycyrrhizinilyticus]
MKNTTFEAIRNGQEVATEELFNLINAYNFTDLVVQDENNHAIVKIPVNHYEEYRGMYEFSQTHSDNGVYVAKKSDIVSVESDYREDMDTLFIKCQMDDGKKLFLVIYHASTNFKTTESDEYYETDLEDLQNFLENTLGDDAEYHCGLVRFTDKNGMSIKITSPERTYINTLDDLDWKLHISDLSMVLEVPVTDDDCNAFYRKDDGDTVIILVKPYEQPFAEIRMVFCRE